MREDPLDNEVLNDHTQHANDHDNVISTIETSQGWSDRRDNLANEMFNEWNARLDMTDSSVPSGAADSSVLEALEKTKEYGKYSGADNGFKPGYDKAVQALLDVSLPNSGTSGFGWDPEKCVLTAPDDVWADYIKEKKHAAPFKDKALPYYEKLCTVFGKNRATGARAEDLGDDEIIQETPPVSPIDVDMDVPISSGVGNKRKRSKTIEFSDTFKECSIDLTDKT
ncbi:hypothetical protein Tco_1469306 [Tanacetum coccineum]